MKKLEIGSGKHPKNGYDHLDIMPFKHVEYVCNAWEIPVPDGSYDEVYSRHLFEHLSPVDAQKALAEWLRVLVPGGFVDMEVPDLEYHCKQIFMDGNSELFERKGKVVSNFEHAISSIYGWVKHGETWGHKWGYTESSLGAMLLGNGFVNIHRVKKDPWNLRFKAFKQG